MDATINGLRSSGVAFLQPGETHEDVMNNVELHANRTLGDAKLTATYGMLWIDVEGTQYWSSSPSSNVNFIQSMVNEGVKQGVSIGIYTSNSQWSPICGGSTQFKNYPLWYPHYDNWASFGDFSAFGGWTKPAIKQYYGNAVQCSVGIDKNFY
jgi:hypothetical protein